MPLVTSAYQATGRLEPALPASDGSKRTPRAMLIHSGTVYFAPTCGTTPGRSSTNGDEQYQPDCFPSGNHAGGHKREPDP